LRLVSLFFSHDARSLCAVVRAASVREHGRNPPCVCFHVSVKYT
jgi:hypothetical protein